MVREAPQKFSPESERAGLSRPGTKTACSTLSGWSSLLLQTFEQPGIVERYETVASPDVLLVFLLRGEYRIESLSAGSWKQATYRPGMGGVTAPHTSNYLRWHTARATQSTLLRLYIPQQYFAEARDEYRRVGVRCSGTIADTLAFSDPLLFAVARSLLTKASQGAPDLYADSGARFLATHLISLAEKKTPPPLDELSTASWTDRRFARVVDYMQNHLSEPLTLDQLASEAALSRFHFARLFKLKMGVSPHSYLVQLRIEHAATLLTHTELSVADVAMTCGYEHCGHFAAAFYDRFAATPSAFRKRKRS